MFDKIEAYLSAKILKYLARPTGRYAPFYAPDPDVVRDALQPGDILLVEGNTRLAATIKYLTQSTWSHAALYVGERPGDVSPHGEPNVLLEAEAETGVVTVPLSKYVGSHTRICRAVGLDDANRQKVIDYALKRLGTQYDSQRIVDLARYLFPYPPVPVWFRRRMLSIGCGDPTRAICSTLIAQAYASIHYPILPERASINGKTYGIAPYVQERDGPHPHLRPLHAARFRRVAVFRHHQTHACRRLRLSHRAMGTARGFRRRFAARRDRASAADLNLTCKGRVTAI